MLNRKWLLLSVVFVLAVAMAVPSVDAAKRRYLSIASGWVTGAYYPFAGAVSRVAWKHLQEKNIKITAESSGASVANAKLIGKSDTDFALLVRYSDQESAGYDDTLSGDDPDCGPQGCQH
jgi:TRAP-type uncharacterized transport system substrate-binding protein